MEPHDNYAYDPLAEAIGWLIRACAGLETWLNVAVCEVEGADYRKVERSASKDKVERLTAGAPELETLGHRILGVFGVRHGIAHGIGATTPDRYKLRTELLDRNDPYGGPKFRLHDRSQLVGFANEARALGW